MSFKPKGVVFASDIEKNNNDQERENHIEHFVLLSIIKKDKFANEFAVIAKPAKSKYFSMEKDGGSLTFEKTKLYGFSKIFFTSNFDVGDSISSFGRWVSNNGTMEFKSEFIYEEIPKDTKTLLSYLSKGRLPRIRQANASKIIEKWGNKVFDILDYETEKLIEINGITEKDIPLIKEKWQEVRKYYEIITNLYSHGIDENIALKIIKYYQELYPNEEIDIVDEIKRDPYSIIKIKGLSFKKVDEVARTFNASQNSKKRIISAFNYIFDEIMYETGNTAVNAHNLITRLSVVLGFDIEKTKKCCQWLINNDQVIFKKIHVKDEFNQEKEIEIFVSKHIDTIEKDIVENFKRLISVPVEIKEYDQQSIDNFINSDEIIADDNQKVAILQSIKNKISVVTGGPGTGKTTTCKNIVHILVDILKKPVYLAAPTGKAAQRMGEQIGQGIEAVTIHTLLDSKMYSFGFNKYVKLPMGVYIIDESSMIDVFLLSALLDAMPTGAMIIFVGDKDQLQSVGPGDILRDIINSNIFNIVQLKEGHRYKNGREIIDNAQLINRGKMPELKGSFEKNSGFIFKNKNTDSEILEEIVETSLFLNSQGVDFKDIQVISPQKNRLVGVDIVNMKLRPYFNPLSVGKESFPFFNGDRVMQTENDYEKTF